MANFLAELKRRHIYRVGAAYVVVAWALTQLVEILEQIFSLPLWIAQSAIVLLAVGFPVVLFVAWTIESKPHHAIASAVRSKPTIVDWTLCSAVAVLIALSGYRLIAPSSNATTRQAGVNAAIDAAISPATAVSIAVLPFTNLSSDPEQEFFSDGITEEITGALAKVPDLRVVGRTSAFEFKGQNRDLRAIGQSLSATHLIEGSVRKAGERVRITAQLINAGDGTHLWSENYDRELIDIFAIQEDIARAIATSLRMPLGLRPGENLIASRNIDPEIYQEYLRLRAREGATFGNAARLEMVEGLEKLLARAPNFAKAWGHLSQTSLQSELSELYNSAAEPPQHAREQLPILYDKAEKAAREAIRLDESEVTAHETLALVAYHRNNWTAAEDLFRKGLEVDPYNPDLLTGYALFSTRTGRVHQGLELMRKTHALEPLSPGLNFGLAWAYVANNQPGAAIAVLEGRPGLVFAPLGVLASAYAMTGQFDKAADLILQMGRGNFGTRLGQATFEDMSRLMRNAPQKVADPKTLPPLHETMNFVYAYVGAEVRLLDFAERSLEVGMFGELRYLFNPVYSPARRTERFKTLVRNAGLVQYWRARGWPDMCRPTTGNDFECN